MKTSLLPAIELFDRFLLQCQWPRPLGRAKPAPTHLLSLVACDINTRGGACGPCACVRVRVRVRVRVYGLRVQVCRCAGVHLFAKPRLYL
jgi:hypothetical protein